uniref:Uncharacterized protein n=1 Tax=Anguilla anguilla TaxID=7936 RepID=A0A0E9W6A0_ANGAN
MTKAPAPCKYPQTCVIHRRMNSIKSCKTAYFVPSTIINVKTICTGLLKVCSQKEFDRNVQEYLLFL